MGQVQVVAAGAAGQPGGDREQGPVQRGEGGLGEAGPGQGGDRPAHGDGHRGQGQPGGRGTRRAAKRCGGRTGPEVPGRQAGHRALLELGGALLDDGVRAVLPLHGQERFDPVGAHRVVAPHGNVEGLLVQRLAGGGLPQPPDPAHDQPGGHRLLGGSERGGDGRSTPPRPPPTLLSTARKHEQSAMDVLRDFFTGHAWIPAISTNP